LSKFEVDQFLVSRRRLSEKLDQALEGIAKGIRKETEYVFSSPELLQANIQIRSKKYWSY
jgi:hypothetical protein